MADDFDFKSVRKNFFIINILMVVLNYLNPPLEKITIFSMPISAEDRHLYIGLWIAYTYYFFRYKQEIKSLKSEYRKALDSAFVKLRNTALKKIIVKEVNLQSKLKGSSNEYLSIGDIRYDSNYSFIYRTTFKFPDANKIGPSQTINIENLRETKLRRLRFTLWCFIWSYPQYFKFQLPGFIAIFVLIYSVLRYEWAGNPIYLIYPELIEKLASKVAP